MLTKASVGLGRVQLQTPENSNHQDGGPSGPTLCCNFVIHNSQGSYEILYSENSLGTVLHDRMKKKKVNVGQFVLEPHHLRNKPPFASVKTQLPIHRLAGNKRQVWPRKPTLPLQEDRRRN